MKCTTYSIKESPSLHRRRHFSQSLVHRNEYKAPTLAESGADPREEPQSDTSRNGHSEAPHHAGCSSAQKCSCGASMRCNCARSCLSTRAS
ncbi:hypothetical protein BU16DRAFT_19226 [Lophium mytilinum]|uniref:Uncharacterized protein n=1 Tax=Lophium mytilinum TaxID=390894 RepID=A0A6A6RGG6_9PEZI|nr:hypothetical protein BU16DRAFT_19226 [Lophium mytilinum]